MENTPPPLHGQPYSGITPPETCGLAIASLVLGLLGCLGVTAIGAVVCGHLALNRIGKSAGRLTGSGMAVAGLVMGYLFSVIVGISFLAGLALPVFGEVREKATLTKALSDAKQIGTACKIYAIDHDGKFPEDLEDLVPDFLPDAAVLECRYPDPKNPVGFEYFGGTDKDDPQKVLLSSPAVPGKGRVFVYVNGSGVAKSRQQLKRGD